MGRSIEIYELEAGRYVERLTASREDVVVSRTLPGCSFRAQSIFP